MTILSFFITALKHIYKNHGGMENVFSKQATSNSTQAGIHYFKTIFFEIPHAQRTQKHISDPLNGSAAKRLNMLERQRAGIELAKLQGKYKGRLYGSSMTNEEFLKKYKKVVQELENGESLRRAARLGGCSLGLAQKDKRLMMVEI